MNLTCVLVQGAVTLADHAASAHSGFLMCQPLGAAYPKTLADRLENQNLASINAMSGRLRQELNSAGRDDLFGVAHSRGSPSCPPRCRTLSPSSWPRRLASRPALVEPPADWTWPVRHRLHLRPGHLTAPATVAEVRQRLRAGESVLVVANNVADALHLYELLAPEAIAAHGQDAALLLHSRFKSGDRATIEDKILARFEAGKPHHPGLLVATQTVEVSLNVDFDALHTSAAPLEPLIQRFGRVNRLGSRTAPAPVIIHQPSYGPRRDDPSEYADGVYDAEPTRLACQILTRHDGGELDEKLFGQWLDEVYASAWGQEWQADVEREYRNWKNDWLQFQQPFDNRENLADEFDKLFDGAEAILEQDADAYRDLMNKGTMAQGRLLAADLLLPIPAYGKPLGRWDKELSVTVIDGDYDPQTGLRMAAPGAGPAAVADDLPGVPGHVVRADGGGGTGGGIGLGHTRDCRRSASGPAAGHAGFAMPFTAASQNGERPGLRPVPRYRVTVGA